MHSGETRQFRLEMPHRAQGRIVRVEITESAPQQMENLRRRVLRLGAEFDEFNEVGRGLCAHIILSNADKRIPQDRLRKRVKIRSGASLLAYSN